MKQRIGFIAALAILAGLIFGCGIFSERYEKTETEELTISTAGRTSLSVDNISGRIELHQSSDSGTIRVVARKEVSVRKKDLDKPFDEIRLRVDSSGSEIRIDSDYRTKTRIKFFDFGNERGPRVDYDIYVPSNIAINVSNINGDVVSERLNTDVSIELVNGDVSIDNYTGLFESEITNGDITLDVDSTSGIDIETVNGSVDLMLSDRVNAKLKVESTNGKISDENLSMQNIKKEKKSLKADLGTDPSTSISVSTVNGRIALKGKGTNWQ